MPSNNDLLLGRDLTENNLPRFVLTCAIDLGIYPPEYILEKYGRSYGGDMDIYSHEEYAEDNQKREQQLARLNEMLVDEQKLIEDVDEVYSMKLNGSENMYWLPFGGRNAGKRFYSWSGYKHSLKYYEENLEEVDKMLTRIKMFVPKNEMQTAFLNEIEKSVLKMHNEVYRPEKPVKETLQEARTRVLAEIEEVKKQIAETERTIKFLLNKPFFEELAKDWFDKQ